MKIRCLLLAAAAVAVAVLPSARDAHAEFRPITPCRLLDTRSPGEGPAILSGTTRYVAVKGVCGIPPSATSITYNVTAVTPGAAGFLTLYPSDVTLPTASSLNFGAGDVQGNSGVVKLADSSPELAAHVKTSSPSATAHIVIDVTGYHAGSLVALAARMLGENYTANRWIDHADGTVTDRLTGLQWEKKTDDNLLHDKDNVGPWSLVLLYPSGLNKSPCFAGYCDWRLPTIDELQSLSEPGHPSCTTPPCTEIPGETATGLYWAIDHTPDYAWTVNFGNGLVATDLKTNQRYFRVVRDGTSH